MKNLILFTFFTCVTLIACKKSSSCKDGWKDKNDSSYEKVIVEALQYSDGCDCAVSGIIEYYEKSTLTATVNYGTGECDNYAIKTTPDGTVYEFDPCDSSKKDSDKSTVDCSSK